MTKKTRKTTRNNKIQAELQAAHEARFNAEVLADQMATQAQFWRSAYELLLAQVALETGRTYTETAAIAEELILS